MTKKISRATDRCGKVLGEDMNGKPIRACGRVEISPSFDIWMRGAKYGDVMRRVRSGKHKDTIAVRMDNKRVRVLYARPFDLKVI